MTKRTRRLFSAEFKLEAAQLVLDQNYSVNEAAQAMNVGKSTMDKWVRQLREGKRAINPTFYSQQDFVIVFLTQWRNYDSIRKTPVLDGHRH